MKFRKLALLLCSLIFISAFVGCGNESSKVDISDNSNSTSQEQNETSLENSSEGFDWETVKQDITLDGKKIDFPFSVNDLGEGYEMGTVSDDFFEEDSCNGLLKKTGEYGSSSWVCTLYFDGLKSDEYNDDIKCTKISAAETLTVQGIGRDSSLEDAEKLWGKPYTKDDVIAFYLNKNGTECVKLCYDSETDKVTYVEITLNLKE